LFTLRLRQYPIVPILLFVLAGIACSGGSSSFGRFYSGETLVASVITIERAPSLFYLFNDVNQDAPLVQLNPSQENLELVMVRMKVQNHTATRAIVNMELQAAELRDFFGSRYFSIDVSPKDLGGKAERIDDMPGNKSWSLPDEQGFLRDAVELEKNTGLDGWLVFEAPKETRFQELWWRAGDSIKIQF
jgi:hypothetical protein